MKLLKNEKGDPTTISSSIRWKLFSGYQVPDSVVLELEAFRNHQNRNF